MTTDGKPRHPPPTPPLDDGKCNFILVVQESRCEYYDCDANPVCVCVCVQNLRQNEVKLRVEQFVNVLRDQPASCANLIHVNKR